MAQKDAYEQILQAIDLGAISADEPLLESKLAEQFNTSRTPIREALQRLETQSILVRRGRSLFVAVLGHDEMSELYVVRANLEALAAKLAAKHASPEEVLVLQDMVDEDRRHADDPEYLVRTNRQFHYALHRASHNRFLVQQLNLVYRSMALMATTSLAVDGRGATAIDEHDNIVRAIGAGDEAAADAAVKHHLSQAFVTRLKAEL